MGAIHQIKKRLKSGLRQRWLSLTGKAKDDNRRFDAIIGHFLKSHPSPVIFDVGAHRGESIIRYKSAFPSSTIHAFEPDEENFKILKEKCSHLPNVILNNCGVSKSKGNLTFHRNMKSSTSSFHAINTKSAWAKNRSARHSVVPEEFTVKSYDVPVIDLDRYISENEIHHIHLLKLDTQGHEDEVLAGAVKSLESGMIDLIETELILGDAYVKSLQFYDLEKTLIPLKYKLYAIDRSGDLLASPALSINAIYTKAS